LAVSYERGTPVGGHWNLFCRMALRCVRHRAFWCGGSAVLPPQRLVFCCRTTSASTAPCTSRRMCCPTHGAGYCAPCQPLLRAFSGWIRSPPPTRPSRLKEGVMRISEASRSNRPRGPRFRARSESGPLRAVHLCSRHKWPGGFVNSAVLSRRVQSRVPSGPPQDHGNHLLD